MRNWISTCLVASLLSGCPAGGGADYEKAVALVKTDRDKANGMFREMIKKNPEQGEPYLQLGNIAYETGFREDAVEFLRKGTERLEKATATIDPTQDKQALLLDAYRKLAFIEIRRAANMIDKSPEVEAKRLESARLAKGYLEKGLALAPDDKLLKEKLAAVKEAYKL